MLPLGLLIGLSPLVYKAIKLNLVTAIIVSLIIALVVDIATRRDFKQCCKDSQAIFEGMGKVFTSTVSFIVCAEMLALGLNKIGGISTMIQAAASIQNAGLFIMLIVMLVIMIVAAIVTGSGNAAFFAFSPLLPEAASSVGIPTLALAVPVQLSAPYDEPDRRRHHCGFRYHRLNADCSDSPHNSGHDHCRDRFCNQQLNLLIKGSFYGLFN